MGKINPPKLELLLGMEVYKSKTAGVGGKIKQVPEDFIVEEITSEGDTLELDRNTESMDRIKGEYIHFTLQKKNWDTIRAIKEISKRCCVSYKRFGFAGTKDKKALTTQRVSVWNKSLEEMQNVHVKDIKLGDFRYADYEVKLGDLWGNRFTILIRNLEGNDLTGRINTIGDELKTGVPNFFGVQRFGTTRPITHLVGREILRGDFRKAVMVYLADVYEEESEEAMNARKFLSETGDFKESLRRFPKYLGYENSMLNFLVKEPENFIGALRVLPNKLRLMFVHAYQGYVFNKALSSYLNDDLMVERLPLPGYETEIDELSSRILDEEGVNQEDFRVERMKEISSKGRYRDCFVPVENFSILGISNDEMNAKKKKATIRFSLSKGNYATVFLRELMKNEYW